MSKQLLQTNLEKAIEEEIPRASVAWVFVNDLQEGPEFDFARICKMPLTVSVPILTAMADKAAVALAQAQQQQQNQQAVEPFDPAVVIGDCVMRAYNEAYQSGRMLKQKEKDERMRKKADQVKERLASLPSTSSTEIAEAPLMKDVLDLIRPAGASQDLLPLPDVHPTPIAAHNEVYHKEGHEAAIQHQVGQPGSMGGDDAEVF